MWDGSKKHPFLLTHEWYEQRIITFDATTRIDMKFLGFLIFVVIASAAFFVPVALGATAPLAAKPTSEEEEDEEETEA